MFEFVCYDNPPPAALGDCVSGAWVPLQQFLPPLTVPDALTLAAELVGLWVLAVSIRMLMRMLWR